MLRLIRTCNIDTDVVGLLFGELGQFYTDALEVQACNFFIENF